MLQPTSWNFLLAIDQNQKIQVKPRLLGDDLEMWGLSGHVVKTGKELFWLTEEQGLEKCREINARAILIGNPCQSCFYLPLKIGKKVIGIISIQSYDEYAFNNLLFNVFRTFGSLLSAALENRLLFQAEETRRLEAEALRQGALAISLDLNRNQLTERLLTELQKVVPYDSSSVQLLRGDRFVIVDGRGFPNLAELIGFFF